MDNQAIKFEFLEDYSDNRGISYALKNSAIKYLDKIDDMHIATVEPGCVRGNHFHKDKREFIAIIYQHEFKFGYLIPEETDPVIKEFSGCGALVVQIEKEITHAIKNTGNKPLFLVACSSIAYDFSNPDINRKVILQ